MCISYDPIIEFDLRAQDSTSRSEVILRLQLQVGKACVLATANGVTSHSKRRAGRIRTGLTSNCASTYHRPGAGDDYRKPNTFICSTSWLRGLPANYLLHPIDILLNHDLHAPIRVIIIRLLRCPRHIVIVVGDALYVLDLFARRVLNQTVDVNLLVFCLLFTQSDLAFVFLRCISVWTVAPTSSGNRLTISNSSSRSSYSTFSSTSSNPPANAPHRSGVGQCHIRMLPTFVVETIEAFLGCHWTPS